MTSRYLNADYRPHILNRERMDRVLYLESRERVLNKQVPLSPKYAAESADISQFRLVCVERIYRLAALTRCYDGITALATIRLFDRCMGKMSTGCLCKANMLILAVASFDICYKLIEGDFKTPGMLLYYREGFLSRMLDFSLPFERFPQKIKEAEIAVLCAVQGEPTSPTAIDYLYECCPDWAVTKERTGRRAAAAVLAYSYSLESTGRSSVQIAAGAAWLALGSGSITEWPTPELASLCLRVPQSLRDELAQHMAASMYALFEMGASCMLYYFFRDVYEDWQAAHQQFVIYSQNKE